MTDTKIELIKKEKEVFKKTAILLCAAWLLTFIVYHLMTYTVKGTFGAYFFFYWKEIFEFSLPVLAALSLYFTFVAFGRSRALLRALVYSLAYLLFIFPYYAFVYAYEGYEITGVLVYASINAFFDIIVMYIELIVLYLLISIVTGRAAMKRGIENERLVLKSASPLSLDAPLNLGIIAASSAMFIYKLTLEIIDTVSFFVSVGGSYVPSEIIYIAFRYIFILALLFAAYFIASFIKNRELEK